MDKGKAEQYREKLLFVGCDDYVWIDEFDSNNEDLLQLPKYIQVDYDNEFPLEHWFHFRETEKMEKLKFCIGIGENKSKKVRAIFGTLKNETPNEFRKRAISNIYNIIDCIKKACKDGKLKPDEEKDKNEPRELPFINKRNTQFL